jgi:hypothetical protein
MNKDPGLAVLQCARAGWEAVRAYRAAQGDDTRPAWEQVPNWLAQSTQDEALRALGGAAPKQGNDAAQHELFFTVVRAAALAVGLPTRPLERSPSDDFTRAEKLHATFVAGAGQAKTYFTELSHAERRGWLAIARAG